ncbi:nucleocapsid protein [Sedlec virus]|uniref:Nucleoprotein n=1 Tax=Sedlec virus TaxID=1383888 RepID=A0A346JEY5_9VIRU|nr:nucleocapsid protein [Sedlec virus]AXP32060.1 nucleocapsid protein [Sedlec virus]
MANAFEFTDVARANQNTFVPTDGYNNFIAIHGQHLNPAVVRIFFVNQKKAKAALAKTTAKKVSLKFGDLRVDVVNNHYAGDTVTSVGDNDLTLHRLSGYLALWTLKSVQTSPAFKLDAEQNIVLPLAEVKGCTWNNGASMYLAFAPGAEMFLKEFEFFPLAIDIQRVLIDKMEVQYMRKTLRQRYGEMTAEQWMKEKLSNVKLALAAVQKLPWAASGFSAAARAFLKEFGIEI